MEADQQGTPGASDPTGAAPGAEAQASSAVTTPDASLAVTQHEGAEAPAGDSPDAGAATDAEAAEAADLAQYPEAVREKFRSLAPEDRKALYEEAEKRAEARITANRERTEKLEAAEAARLAKHKEILARHGQFVGAEAQTIELPNGVTVQLPSREEMRHLSQNQRGRSELLQKYGLDEEATEFWCTMLDRSAQAMDASQDWHEDAAWGKLDASLRSGIQAELGVDPDTILLSAANPHEVIKGIVSSLKTEHAAQMAKQKHEYEGRLEAVNANTEGMRGRVLAATSRSLPTGGRSGGAPLSTAAELKRLRAENPSEFAERAMRGDFAGLDLTQ